MTGEFTNAFERYRPYLSLEEFNALEAEANQPAASAVRLNLSKLDTSPLHRSTTEGKKGGETGSDRLKFLSQKFGWVTQPLPFSENSLQILDFKTAPSQTREYLLGQYYLQDAASILPVSLFSATKKPQLKLDMAASPGGKTTQMIDASLDRDFLIANDSAASRLPALRTVLQTWGAANYAITNYPGERFGDWFPETFDQILLDAPCSMQSLRASASHPHRPITEDERSRLANRQIALLFSAAKALKVGGELVYSTCTLNPEEDEAVVSALLEAFPGAFHLDPAPAQKYQVRGFTEFEGQQYHPDLIHALRIWTFTFKTNGFFAAKLIKDAPISHEPGSPPTRDFRVTGYKHLSPELHQELINILSDIYGIELKTLLNDLGLIPMRKEDAIHLFPAAYLESFKTLPFTAIGLPLGRYIRDRFETGVEFILRFGGFFTQQIWEMPEEFAQQWMRGFDIRGFNLEGFQPSTIIAVRDAEGNNLGAAKYTNQRLRNLLPNRHIRNN